MSQGPTWLAAFLAAERLPPDYIDMLNLVAIPLADQIAAAPGPITVGLCGSQGSGKSTLAGVLSRLLADRGLRVATLSLDDLYLTRFERQALARDVHPLLATRGPPGTHDVALGLDTLDALTRPGQVALPRFDKARDNRSPEEAWDRVDAPSDVVLFEGWCVGALPQDAAALATPVNALEREQDRDGIWRRYVNDALAGAYQALFGRLGRLVMLKAPGFDTVLNWRLEQEHKLRDRLRAAGKDLSATMSDDGVATFIAHYERLTRHILAEMPARADAVVRLDAERRPLGMQTIS